MFANRLFKTLIAVTLFYSTQACASTSDQRDTVLQVVESFIKDKKSNAQGLRKLIQDIGDYRKKFPRQPEDVQIELDILVAALEEIPVSTFDKKKCKQYRHSIILQFDPTSEDKPQNPAVREALKVLDRLCK